MHTFLPKKRLDSLLSVAKRSSDLSGQMAELGVAYGYVCEELAKSYTDKTVYAFDTFEGFSLLPDSYFNASPNFDVKIYKERFERTTEWDKNWGSEFPWEKILENLNRYSNIVVKKGLFPDTAVGLNESFCFVHLDVDIYKSTLLGLEYFYERLVPGGSIVIDDYFEEHRYPGVKDAVDECRKKFDIKHVDASVSGQGIIIKP